MEELHVIVSCDQLGQTFRAAPRVETENNAYVKFWSDQQRVLWYVMAFSFDPVQKLSLECSFRRSAGPVRFRDLEQSRINLRHNTDMLSDHSALSGFFE